MFTCGGGLGGRRRFDRNFWFIVPEPPSGTERDGESILAKTLVSYLDEKNKKLEETSSKVWGKIVGKQTSKASDRDKHGKVMEKFIFLV